MTDQLDLSRLAGIAAPELRSSLERLGNAMQDAPAGSEPETPSSAKLIQFPLFPETTRPVANDMARSALFSCVQGKDRVYKVDRGTAITGSRRRQWEPDGAPL